MKKKNEQGMDYGGVDSVRPGEGLAWTGSDQVKGWRGWDQTR